MLAALVAKYCRKGILVDTNLLIGYIIGRWDRRHLRKCRATKAFSIDDFDLLDRFLGNFHELITTPHILTEISNLAGKLPQAQHHEFRAVFQRVIDGLTERFEASKSIAARPEFVRFGLTDTAITALSPGKYLVLTDELALFGALQKRGVDVVNFNHLRMESPRWVGRYRYKHRA